MRNFGIEEIETGNSSIWLLAKVKISRFARLAMPGGIATKQEQIELELLEIKYFNFTYFSIDYGST